MSHLRAVLLDLGSKDTGLALSGSIDQRPEFQKSQKAFRKAKSSSIEKLRLKGPDELSKTTIGNLGSQSKKLGA